MSGHPNSKKLVDMERDELLAVTLELVEILKRKRGRHLPDLPPNKQANARHQRMKQIWGRKKSDYLNLLRRAVVFVPAELAAEIQYAIDHDEFLYQRRFTYERGAKQEFKVTDAEDSAAKKAAAEVRTADEDSSQA